LKSLDTLQDRTLLRSRARSTRYILARINAPAVETDKDRPSADICFVLDRSGSMSGGKFRLARKAVEQGIQRLSPRDSFSVVVYDEQIDVIVPATRATADARANAIQRLASVAPRGTTNLAEGWLTGCGQVAEHLTESRIGRCLLLTDGLANRGITDPSVLSMHAQQLRQRGVSTSTFGVGSDYDEVLLGQMADAGGGAFTHIRTPQEIPGLIDQELSETLEIAARGVTLTVTVPNGVRVTPVGPFPFDKRDDGICVQIPDLVSEQDFELPLCLRFPRGEEDDEIVAEITLDDREDVISAVSHLTWTWASHEENDQQPRNREVERIIAERYAAIAREEASQLNRDRRYDRAAQRLQTVARRIESYAGDDPDLHKIMFQLRIDADIFGAMMSSMNRKTLYSESSSLARGGTGSSLRKKRF
jgi:Ca-activated chloride channel family protein